MVTQPERSRSTRAALCAAGRELFAEHGFNTVNIEEIITRAGVSRGALYHHFDGKTQLFTTIVEDIEATVSAAAIERMAKIEDPIDALLAGNGVVFDLCMDPVVLRLSFVEAPAVLGWARWRELCERNSLGVLTEYLKRAMALGRIPRRPVAPVAHLLHAASVELILLMANSPQPLRARRECEREMTRLVHSLAAPV
ncbi:MAG TPA: TetR/AcrR family transcriptional regulator [Sporichthyaceae bacterium]